MQKGQGGTFPLPCVSSHVLLVAVEAEAGAPTPCSPHDLSLSNTKALELGAQIFCAPDTFSGLALPIGPRDSSLCAQNKQAQPLQKVPQGVLDLPPSPGTPRPTPPPPYYWPQWGSCEAPCLLHSFPECLGSVRKLTVLFVWGAFCHVMNNSCN